MEILFEVKEDIERRLKQLDILLSSTSVNNPNDIKLLYEKYGVLYCYNLILNKEKCYFCNEEDKAIESEIDIEQNNFMDVINNE